MWVTYSYGAGHSCPRENLGQYLACLSYPSWGTPWQGGSGRFFAAVGTVGGGLGHGQVPCVQAPGHCEAQILVGENAKNSGARILLSHQLQAL